MTIIIERSQEAMRVVRIWNSRSEAIRELAYKICDRMQNNRALIDYDVLSFDDIDDLNNFLFDNIKI